MRHPRCAVLPRRKPLDFSGYPGDYTLRVSAQGRRAARSRSAPWCSRPRRSPRCFKSCRTSSTSTSTTTAASPRATSGRARSQTQDRGVFVVNPPTAQRDDLATALARRRRHRRMVMSLLDQQRDPPPRGGERGAPGAVRRLRRLRQDLHVPRGVAAGQPRVSVIDPRRCRGCGNCVTACPAGARDLVVCPRDYLSEAIRILARVRAAAGEQEGAAHGLRGLRLPLPRHAPPTRARLAGGGDAAQGGLRRPDRHPAHPAGLRPRLRRRHPRRSAARAAATTSSATSTSSGASTSCARYSPAAASTGERVQIVRTCSRSSDDCVRAA